MATTEDVKVKILVDNSQATSALEKTKKSFAGVQESAGKMAAGAGILTAGLGGMVYSMLEGAGKAEQLQVAFTTMTGSAEVATKTLASLTDFAAKTPFQLPEVQEAAKKLLAFGTAADDIEPTLRKLGDVSAGIGAPLAEIAELYGKAKVQGRLFGEDINQLTNRGIPIIGELAKVLGTTEGNVKDMVAAGKVGFPELEQAFTNMTAQGSQFGGLMAAQSETFLGQVSNIQDAIGQLMVSMGQSLMPIAKQIAESFGWVTEAFKNMSPETKEAIGQAIALALAIAGVIAVIAGIIAIINPVTVGIGLIVAAFLLWKMKGQEIMDYFEPWTKKINDLFTRLAGFIQDNWFTISAIIDGALSLIKLTWDIFAAQFTAAVQIAFELITGIISVALSIIQGDWSGAWNTMKATFMSVMAIVQAAVLTVWTAITEFIKAKLTLMGVDVGAIMTAFQKTWNDIWTGIQSTTKTVVDAITNIVNTIKKTIEGVTGAIINLVNEARKAATSIPGIGGLFGGPKASGGPVSGGTTYLVGEQGPELFTPSGNGKIIPNHAISGGGGGSTIVINFNGLVSSKAVAEQYADQVVRKLQLTGAIV